MVESIFMVCQQTWKAADNPMLSVDLRLTVGAMLKHGRIYHYVPTVWHETLTPV